MKSLIVGGLFLMAGILSLLGKDKNKELPEVSLGFTTQNQNGETVSLEDVAMNSNYLLVYFYPKADTPGCTAQACSLRDAFQELKEKKVAMFGVSSDSVEKLKKFSEKYKLPFDLLSDPKGEIAKGFSVPNRFGFFSRQAFLIQGTELIWHDESASTRKQAEDLLAVLAQNAN